MIDPRQLRDNIVMPVLTSLNLPSDKTSNAACELLLGTAMQESGLRYLVQISGPALGIWQMEPTTFNWLASWASTRALKLPAGDVSQLPGNLYLACAMARLRYYVVPEALPAQGDVEAQARYWKQYYNTPAGAGTVQQYLDNWSRLVKEMK